MSTREFTFIGFLSANNKERKDKLEEIKYETRTLIFYEAPHRLESCLKAMLEVLGDRKIVLVRELTKIHEEFIRGSLSTVFEQIVNCKGEFVIILEGNSISKKDEEIKNLNNLSLDEHYNFYKNQGFDKKEIIKRISKDRGIEKNIIYKYFI